MNVADSIQQSSELQKSQSSEGLYFSFQVPNQPLQSPLEVCQTAGFVQHSQNVKPPKPPSNVRFIVQPVMTEDELTSSTTSFNNEDHNTPSEPSDVAYSYRAENLSSDDLTSNYNMLGSDPQAQLTVRSMASIGLGSSNGRKIHLRRVHTTGAESLMSPLLTSPTGEVVSSQQWPFPSLNITVNGKTIGTSGCANETKPESSDDESGSSSSDSSLSNSNKKDKKKKQHRARWSRHHHKGQVWGSRLEFLLACIGFAAGLANVWRFPYMAFKSGGGAFLVPYSIMVFLCGIPLQTLELAIGQYTREGPVEAMKSICPLFSGVGIGMVMLSMLLSSYYSVAMSWAMLYLGSSFVTQLPWTHCNNTWNTEFCRPATTITPNQPLDNSSTFSMEAAFLNGSSHFLDWVTPGQEFFDRRILQMSTGVDIMGDIRWELVACLLVAWFLIFITIRKSVRWSGKAVYVTATLPYLLLLALAARALTLDGADDGLRYFFHPDWSILLKSEVWMNALAQTFMSLGVAYGCLIAFASYNRFHSPFIRDGLCLSVLNSIISLVAGIIVFAALGHTALVHGMPLHLAASDSLGFSLIMYATVVTELPFPQFWAVLFFLVFIFLGLDTQFATVEVVRMTLQKFIKQSFNKAGGWVADLVAVALCVACFIGSFPYITQGGIYLIHLTDYYVCTVAIILLALGVSVATGVFYGAGRLARNTREMTAHSPSPVLIACWAGVSSVIIAGVWIFHLIDLNVLSYDHGQYVFPKWTQILGWAVIAFILAAIPLFSIVAICQANGKSIIKKLINSSKSQMTECPCCRRGVRGLKDTHSFVHLNEINPGADSAFAFAEFAEIHFPEDGAYTITSASSLPPCMAIPISVSPTDSVEEEATKHLDQSE